MTHYSDSRNRLAVGLLVCGTIWVALTVSGLFRVSLIVFPSWVGIFVALGFLAGPLLLVFPESLNPAAQASIAIVFLTCAFILPWFYDERPLYSWLTMLLVYIEVFWLIPRVLKRRRKEHGKVVS